MTWNLFVNQYWKLPPSTNFIMAAANTSPSLFPCSRIGIYHYFGSMSFLFLSESKLQSIPKTISPNPNDVLCSLYKAFNDNIFLSKPTKHIYQERLIKLSRKEKWKLKVINFYNSCGCGIRHRILEIIKIEKWNIFIVPKTVCVCIFFALNFLNILNISILTYSHTCLIL